MTFLKHHQSLFSSVGRAPSPRQKADHRMSSQRPDAAREQDGGRGFESFKSDPFSIRWNEPLGLPECTYLVRWVLMLFGYSIRLHHWVASDDQRHFHDHPWWYVAIILRGGYTDLSPDGADTLRAGSVRFRRAEHRHTVRVADGGCWSLLITGRKSRNWGFYTPGRDRLMRPLRYFSRFGHHPCETARAPKDQP